MSKADIQADSKTDRLRSIAFGVRGSGTPPGADASVGPA